MRIVLAALTAALLAMPSVAHAFGGKRHRTHDQSTEQKKPKVDDAAYKAALDSIPDKKFDPWAQVRPSSQAK